MKMAIIKVNDTYYLAVTFDTENEEPPGEIILVKRKFNTESEEKFRSRVRKAAEREGISHVIGL